jgi:serine/threonine protein kinase
MQSNNDYPIINAKYIVESLIGKGNFGYVYTGYNKKTERKIVIKLEEYNENYITLKNEATILKYLYDNKCYYIPQVQWYGRHKNYIGLVIPKYDCSLYDYVMNNTISLENINSVMVSMLNIIENIHNLFVIHRDIKPHHFMLRDNQLFLIDFGISTFYIDDNKQHKENIVGDSIIGSSNYASYNLYNGNSYSRRDDLISIGYIYMFLHISELPWEQLNKYEYADTYDLLSIEHMKNIECKKLKELTDLIPLCMKINENFGIYMNYCYSLSFDDNPMYISYISLFHV